MRDSSPSKLDIFQHPMCLISTTHERNEEGEETVIELKTEEETLDQIRQIIWPIVIVAVVGLYRTGKSYLMNRLAGSTDGFALGDTIESKTKGIWAWCRVHPERKNEVLLLLDTEGLGDVDKGDPSHDNKIFTLATLLCNFLVYNMKGAFDNDAVAKLTFVTEMVNNIIYRGESSEDNQVLSLILPDFVLCLRDFSLKLKKGDRMLTENEYLDECLAYKFRKVKFNKPRECIRKYFPKRECFAFPVPGDGDVLENLETLSFNDLSGKFQEVATRFVSFIYSKPPKKLLTSKPVNGQMFATLVDHYVTAIKHGAVTDFDAAFEAVAKTENAKIEKEAVAMFEREMKAKTFQFPATVLRNYYKEEQDKALRYLRKNAVLVKTYECENRTMERMNTFWTQIEKENAEKVKEMCETKLQAAYEKHLAKKVANRDYEIASRYRSFQGDMEKLNNEYTSALQEYGESEVVNDFIVLLLFISLYFIF